MKKISVVIPIYNEEESIPYLYKELDEVLSAIEELSKNHLIWKNDYIYDDRTNEFTHKDLVGKKDEKVVGWIENGLS